MVVTIVVLLILAGVSISLLLDENGIIKKSKDARREYGQAKANEQEDLSNLSDMIDEATGKVAKIDVNTKASKNGTINGEEGNSNNPTIPKGYTPINTETSNWGDGTSAPSQDSVDHGLVIKDDSNNEWVWIPVDETTLATMYTTSEDGKTLTGTEVKTNLYSSTVTIGKDSNTKTITRTAPGTIGYKYREPDLVVGGDSISYDAKETNYKTILGKTGTKEELAQLFVDEYKDMIESIKTYGGFYIGRYELSEAGVQKNQPTLTTASWYNLYNACKDTKLQASDKVKTGMIWGCQWDVTMNWLISSGEKTSDEVNKDSSSWGNYKDSTGNAKVVVTENGTEKNKYGEQQNTGSSEYWKANNIYDLAGNCYEWTQEAFSTNYRADRGGSCREVGSNSPAFIRYDGDLDSDSNSTLRYPSNFNNKVGRRV